MTLLQTTGTALEDSFHLTPSGVVDGVALDNIIGSLLGQGLGYNEWKRQLKYRGGFTWSESLKNTIIKREFGYFKDEILRLKAEPNKSRGLRVQSKTNSLESILKRLQGLEWGNGMPDELAERTRSRRLLGKDAKARCLQYHVSRWNKKAGSISSPKSIMNKTRRDSNTIGMNIEMTSSDKPKVRVAPSPEIVPPEQSFGGNSVTHFPPSFSRSVAPPPERTYPSSSNISSLFGRETSSPVGDPTLYGITEIPWVPLFGTQEAQASQDMEMTSDEFFRFTEHNPGFPNDKAFRELSFELPRGDGNNDSYSTYISAVTQSPSTRMEILEQIMDSYGPLEAQDAMMTDNDCLRTCNLEPQLSEKSAFVQQAFISNPSSSEDFLVSPQDLMLGDNSIKIDNDNGWPKSTHVDERGTSAGSNNSGASQQHAQAELQKKKMHLAAAETLVANLREEIKIMETSSRSPDTILTQRKDPDTPSKNPTIHRTKRSKETTIPADFTLGIPQKWRITDKFSSSQQTNTDANNDANSSSKTIPKIYSANDRVAEFAEGFADAKLEKQRQFAPRSDNNSPVNALGIGDYEFNNVLNHNKLFLKNSKRLKSRHALLGLRTSTSVHPMKTSEQIMAS